MKLLGRKGLNIPTVVITDGDPLGDVVKYSGIARATDLLNFMGKSKPFRDENELRSQFEDNGLFVGSNTLEVDLYNTGYKNELIDVLVELGIGEKSLQTLQKELNHWDELDAIEQRETLVKKIDQFGGKGRFAQRLVHRLDRSKNPALYSACTRVCEKTTQ